MKFPLLYHTIVKEVLLALHEGHDHKLKVLVLNKPRKQRGRPKIYENPSTQPAKFSRYLWMSIHTREQSSVEFCSPLAAVT